MNCLKFRALTVLACLWTVTRIAVCEEVPAPSPEAQWSRVGEAMETVKSRMASAGDALRESLLAYDAAAKDFLTRFPKDGRRWQLRFFDGVTWESRIKVNLPTGKTQVDIVNEILEAEGVDEETRSGASAVRALAVHRSLDSDEARRAWTLMAEEHLKQFPVHPANQRIRASLEQVKSLLAYRDRILDLKFTAADGRVVDLAALRGHVVLIDFWESGCPICTADMPGIVQTYNQLHGKGFEIIGICLDKDELEMIKFMEANRMTWPQYYDGRDWDGAVSKQLGVHFTPTVWLVDKTGHLVNTSARAGLEGLVIKLMQE